MAGEPLLIKRYASRRLYNTETSDYVTLEDIATFIREGREVQIVDLKSGDDLTRQYLLQIVADHESKGENVLPLQVLTDLVRSYTTQAQSVVPQFLEMSFDMLREGQSKVIEKYDQSDVGDARFRCDEGATGGVSEGHDRRQCRFKRTGPTKRIESDDADTSELDAIRAQLTAMQEQLAKMGKK